jgi:hypothetical protein
VKVAANIDTTEDRINNAKNSVVMKIGTEISRASKDNNDHVDEIMEHTTNTIIKEINEGTRHLDIALQKTHQSIRNTNKEETEHLITTFQETQLLVINNQVSNFTKTLDWLDNSM